MTFDQIAAYVRASTDKQETSHQRDDINEWAKQNGHDPTKIEWYVDLAESGSDPGRKQFNSLIDDVEAGNYERVITWEISRLSRLGSTYQRFFEVAADADTIVNVTNGWTDTILPDGTGKLIADISAAVAEEERRKLISRINSGVKRARKEGKWLGEVPTGFERNEQGYLRPLINPGEGKVGYLEMREALVDIEAGESYNSAAASMATTRQTLSRIDQDDERRSWYLDGRAEDDRVAEALETVSSSSDNLRTPTDSEETLFGSMDNPRK